ncbi:hypothetical protein D8Y22_04110 [Salinadaptatus halalkaliphilus]|uniref:Uncharacterized protein n=1 Tax=Salinadaptatus halalkaliphilus TaxID=2419781 RepID=A0A4S3TPI0_9EURY|nr:hypothetical protein [Salinadaptatus halalkaliphilus]THE66211.1 hypothetical protein D8Y22_04110 [Salinadaptatus halalkaliphilus]
MDRIDAVTIVGCAGLVALAWPVGLAGVVVAAAFGGFLLSLSVWRLYGGRPWEALGWLAWVGAASSVVIQLDSPTRLVAVVGFGVLGVLLLLGGRFDVLVDVWSRTDADQQSRH